MTYQERLAGGQGSFTISNGDEYTTNPWGGSLTAEAIYVQEEAVIEEALATNPSGTANVNILTMWGANGSVPMAAGTVKTVPLGWKITKLELTSGKIEVY